MLQGFEQEDQSAVRDFMQEHSYLQPLLVELEEVLPEYFPDATFRLSVRREEGVDTGMGSLIIEIDGEASLGTMHERRKAFNRDWWSDHYEKTQNKLFINVNHQDLTDDNP